MKKTLIAASVASLLVVALVLSVHAGVTQNEKLPTSMLVGIPCSGDVVALSGDLHILMAMTVDGNGGLHVKMHFQPQKMQGVVVSGPNMGAKYNAVGVTTEHWNDKMLPFEDTYVNNFYIIGQGKAPTYKVHQTLHITINANGVMTADVANVRITCK